MANIGSCETRLEIRHVAKRTSQGTATLVPDPRAEVASARTHPKSPQRCVAKMPRWAELTIPRAYSQSEQGCETAPISCRGSPTNLK